MIKNVRKREEDRTKKEEYKGERKSRETDVFHVTAIKPKIKHYYSSSEPSGSMSILFYQL